MSRRPLPLVLAALLLAPAPQLPASLAPLGALLPGTSPGLAAPAEKLVNAVSRIDGVTVYPDRAQVRRVARVELDAGLYRIRFPRLARNMMADSIRVGGEGTANAVLHGFDLHTDYLGTSPTKDVADLEAKLVTLNDRDRALNDQRQVHQRQLDTLVETAEKAAGGLAAQLAAGKANLKVWTELLGYLKAQQAAEASAIRGIEQLKRKLATEITAVRTKLNKLRGFRREEVYQVDVTVEAQRPGTLDLTLEYVQPGASWAPAYDARLDPKGERLDWRYYGVVRQSTGENWKDVALRLSTARPASGSHPPTVDPWFLSLWQPPPPPAPAARAMGASRPGQNVFNQRRNRVAKDELEAEASEPQPEEAREAVAAVADQGTSVTLEVPRRLDIPSDGEPHQTPIGQATLKPKMAYRVVPRVTPEAFLEVEAVHPGPWPLLAGAVKAFVGKDYVGTTPLREDIVPNQRFNLPMGVDRSMQVKRSRLAKQVGESGLLGKRGFGEYRYEVTVTNFKSQAAAVTVIEPIPQVTDDAISVSLTRATHAPAPDSPPGQVRWKLDVKPGEKKVLQWGYRVEWPPGQQPTGLE